MRECEVETRKWGNSLGIIIPQEIARKEHIKEHQKIRIFILPKPEALKKTFGMLRGKWRTPTQKIKDEIRRELYD